MFFLTPHVGHDDRCGQDETCLIITINDTSLGYLPLIINISDTCKNQPKKLDFDNTINLSNLIVILVFIVWIIVQFLYQDGKCGTKTEKVGLSGFS